MLANVETLASLKTSVDETRHRHVAAVNAGDADNATNLYAPDAIFLPPGQPVLAGSAAIRGWFQYVFTNFSLQGFRIDPAGIDESGDIAVEHGNWKATFMPRDGSSSLTAGGTYLTIYARLADGRVLMTHDTFNGMPGKA
jgi:uncharacterized protein (TIGR02246 family)